MHTLGIKLKSTGGVSKINGYASVFNVADQHNDVTTQGAFTEAVKRHRHNGHVKLLWQHDTTKPIGVVSHLQEDDYGLLVEGVINQDTQQGREASSLIKQGAVNGLSIGFVIKDYEMQDSGLRKITNLELWEISVVTFPANMAAQINHLHYQSCQQSLINLARSIERSEQYFIKLKSYISL